MSSPALPDITAAPAAGQHVWHEKIEYTTVNEGLAHILIPASASVTPQRSPRGDHQPQSVFYNPIQQFNRDLSVLAIKAYGEGVLERKRKIKAASRQKLAAKQKEKKRKREEDGERLAKLKSRPSPRPQRDPQKQLALFQPKRQLPLRAQTLRTDL
jgi:tRNA (guanine26-N2/guanine27-N2)-dimethyltransferase